MAKSFLASQSSSFTISDDNVYVIGQSGSQVITLLSSASGATLTQTVERVILQGASSSYTYKNSASQLQIYLGDTLVATINPQDDTTGTQLTFSDGTLSLAYGAAGSLTLGGIVLSTTSTTSITPTTFVTTLEGDPAGTSNAKVFLLSTESTFTIHDDNIAIVGNSNSQTVTLKSGVTGASIPQTIENITFESNSTDYTYLNRAGLLEVYSGATLVTKITPQDTDLGTQLTFTDETKSLKFGSAGALTLDGDTVSTDSPSTPTTPTISFSKTNSGLGTLSNSSTFAVSTLDSGNHWSAYPSTITYSFNTTIPSSYYGSQDDLTTNWSPLTYDQKQTVRTIMQDLNEILGTQITEVSSAGDIRFNVISMDEGTAAFAYQPFASTPDYYGDIFLSQAFNTNPSHYGTNKGEFGWLTIVHELGHALGLDHPFYEEGKTTDTLATAYDDSNHTVMSYTNLDNSVPTFRVEGNYIYSDPKLLYTDLYSLYDVATLQTIYGANTTTNTSDTTYTTSYSNYQIQTIWDAGGVDTIDLSLATGSSIIDLTSGSINSADTQTLEQIKTLHKSAINNAGYNTFIETQIQDLYNQGELYTGKNNLSIAHGTIIENLYTGSGADTIYDNEYNNIISTGSGNDAIYLTHGGSDTITGGDGVDTLYINDTQTVVTLTTTATGYSLVGTYFDVMLVGVEQVSYNGSIVLL